MKQYILSILLFLFVSSISFGQDFSLKANEIGELPKWEEEVEKPQSNQDKVYALLLGKADRITDMALDGIEKSIETIKVETPLVIEEFLKWKLLEAVADIVITLTFFTSFIIALICFKKYAVPEWSKDETEGSYFRFLTPLFAVIIFGFLSLDMFMLPKYIKTVVKIEVAPKVYLIEYVVDKVKK